MWWARTSYGERYWLTNKVFANDFLSRKQTFCGGGYFFEEQNGIFMLLIIFLSTNNWKRIFLTFRCLNLDQFHFYKRTSKDSKGFFTITDLPLMLYFWSSILKAHRDVLFGYFIKVLLIKIYPDKKIGYVIYGILTMNYAFFKENFSIKALLVKKNIKDLLAPDHCSWSFWLDFKRNNFKG